MLDDPKTQDRRFKASLHAKLCEMMRIFCCIPIMAFWLFFATSSYALSDDQAEVLAENKGDFCYDVGRRVWETFQTRMKDVELDVPYVLQNLKCSYTDQNADRQENFILHRVTFASNIPGSFADDLIRYLRANTDFETMKSTMWVLIAPDGTKHTLLHDILNAYKAPSTDKKIKQELHYMALTICNNLRLYDDGHLKTIYEDMCV